MNLMQRTYYARGAVYVRAYRPFVYRGVVLPFYAPARYYPLAFYGWAAGPWAEPIYYPWGWLGDPWYSYYGPFFSPYPAYARPSLWLTDFLIAQTLQMAYQNASEDSQAGELREPPLQGTAPMSDQVKSMIDAEVSRQLAEERSEAQAGPAGIQPDSNDSLPPSFSGSGPHLFLPSEALEVETSAGGECQLRGGDAIQMDELPSEGTTAQVRVLASKGSDCPVNSSVSVPLTELVEMNNGMRENIDQGLETLRNSQGTNNIPRLSEPAAAEPVLTPFAAHLQADPDPAGAIKDASGQADKIWSEVNDDAGVVQANEEPLPTSPLPTSPLPTPVPTRAASPLTDARMASVQVGQSEADVQTIMGQPLSESFMGGVKKAYQYPAGKVVFTDGNVSQVEPAGGILSTPPSNPFPVSERATLSGPLGAVTRGQSESEVLKNLGPPTRTSYMGGLKKMYEYPNGKVIFEDGNVSEVQR
jgi:hypothetical protein